MYKTPIFYLFLLAVSLGAGISCTRGSSEGAESSPIAANGLVQHARGFQITDQGTFKTLTIHNPFNPTGDTISYALVKSGQAAPENFPADRIIFVPIKSIAVTSTLHVGAIDQLEAWKFLVAVGDGSQLYSPKVSEMVANGSVNEIQKGAKLNEEKVIELDPDVLMVTGSSEVGLSDYAGITRSGIPVIVNSEWMEQTPLGRAEWIKLMAVLLGRENFADHQFSLVATNYQKLADRVGESVNQRPTVLLGNEYRGTWYMPGGKSFMARILEDAGAAYSWNDNDQTGGVPFTYEAVYPVALDADVWLNIYLPTASSGKAELILNDNRYADFKSVKNNRLYSFNNRVSVTGANDYWESSAFRPDLLLADYIHILHPELIPDHLLYYCKKVD